MTNNFSSTKSRRRCGASLLILTLFHWQSTTTAFQPSSHSRFPVPSRVHTASRHRRLLTKQHATPASVAQPSSYEPEPSSIVAEVSDPTSSASDDEALSTTMDVPSPPTHEEEPLIEGWGVGIRRDFQMRWPSMKSDFTDGLNVQSLAACCFMFFACMAPAVGFGALYAAATNGAIGTVEMVGSTALGGLIYALTAAQPLTIIGSTGPVLSFVATLAVLAHEMQLPFLPLYAWTGLWSAAIMLIASLTSASSVVKYLTRFTDEIFSTLISAIFVIEACTGIGKTFTKPTSSLTQALLTLTCASTTYLVATFLKRVRRSVYFTKTVRTSISNFAPAIAVGAASYFARWARLRFGAEAVLPSLAIPAQFGTTSGRPWLIPIFDLPVWARWASFVPAVMATVLLFLDQNITVRLVNNPRWKMTKGRRLGNMIDGMHWDMLVISLLTAFQSVLGLPWLVAATVRSVSHVSALSTFDQDGKISGTREQRVTGSAIHALIGACVLFDKPRQILTQVPLPVLLGLFMYLGTSALPGNEMWERILSFFKDSREAPKERWASVPKNVTRLFTLVQIACLGGMFWVKESPYGVLFPVVIALLAPIRFALENPKIIKKEHMDVLDED